MAALTDAQQDFLAQPFVGVVTTVRPDGSLHSSVVWVGVEDGDAFFTTLRARAKAQHLERDPRVALAVVDPTNQYRWLLVNGTAELSEEGAAERVEALGRRYAGGDISWTRPGQTWVVARIRADRVESQSL